MIFFSVTIYPTGTLKKVTVDKVLNAQCIATIDRKQASFLHPRFALDGRENRTTSPGGVQVIICPNRKLAPLTPQQLKILKIGLSTLADKYEIHK
eukprot:Awhi_evm1s303